MAGTWGIRVQPPIQNKVLPVARPPNWNYCNNACNAGTAVNMNVEPYEGIMVEVGVGRGVGQEVATEKKGVGVLALGAGGSRTSSIGIKWLNRDQNKSVWTVCRTHLPEPTHPLTWSPHRPTRASRAHTTGGAQAHPEHHRRDDAVVVQRQHRGQHDAPAGQQDVQPLPRLAPLVSARRRETKGPGGWRRGGG